MLGKGIYAMSCASSFLPCIYLSSISYQLFLLSSLSFFLFLFFGIFLFLSSLTWKEWRESLMQQKQRKQHSTIWVSKGEKRGKVYGLFLSCCFPTPLSLSLSLYIYICVYISPSFSPWFPTELGSPTMMNNGCNFLNSMRSFQGREKSKKIIKKNNV